MPDARDAGQELDRLWNDLIAGRGDERGYAVAPDTSETVRAFQAAQTPPSNTSSARIDHVVFAAIGRMRRGADCGCPPKRG